MKIPKYQTIIYFSNEDDLFVAYHPELGEFSCSAEGVTEIKALKNLKKETKDFLKLIKEEGQPVPKPLIMEI